MPFKADGSTGYRDYLVWLTCLETARRYANEEIHFITSNTRDFADPNDKEKLHPDLLSDLVEWKISDSRFYYWNSLKSFIDKFASFLTPVQEFINSKVIGCSLEGYDVFVPGNNEILKDIQSDVGAQIDDVSELDNESLLLGITIDSIGVVTSNLSISDIKEIEEYDLDVEVVDRDNGVCTLETTLGIQVQLRAVYNKFNKAITSIEVDDIDDYNCPYCPY